MKLKKLSAVEFCNYIQNSKIVRQLLYLYGILYKMVSGLKGQKLACACTIRLLNL